MASKSFQVSIDFIGNISDLQSKIKQVTGEINKIGSTSGGVQVQKQFDSLTKAVSDLQTRINQPIKTQSEFNKIANDVQKIELSYNSLIQTIERLQGLSDTKKLELLPVDQQNKIKQAEQAINNYEAAAKKATSATKDLSSAQDRLSKAKGDVAAETAKFKSLTASLAAAEKKYNELRAARDNLTSAKGAVRDLEKKDTPHTDQIYIDATANLQRVQQEADKLRGKYDDIGKAVAAADQAVKRLSSQKLEILGSRDSAKAKVTEIETEIEGLKAKLESTQTSGLQEAFDQLKNKAKELGVSMQGIDDINSIDVLKERLLGLKQQGLDQVDAKLASTANNIRSQINPAIEENRRKVEEATTAWGQFMTAKEDMSMLQNRLKYFFSLTNSIQLLKRTITSAMNTVKELDAVMTETAVVTDFTVGDMWDKLPEYADQASALGASIKDLYAATTLYYQQGLNSEQAMSVGVETMKMARIAGMDAAEATKAMTAALRGFNMEINETSATRINDVYSELAAITAADTEQIATAMSKTASIADSANMEFETTAALLAQIIETTQEAPETAGTAMKTIIARFTEVKQLFDEGMLSGEDSEGEAIEINKIDAALRKVGISLTDFLQGEKGIDDIFLELASKWDTLDLATQRYIATTAAGSRQQSRFIAMMSNYDRTMELVTAANNSAGASQEQFDKTLDSMEAKLQKLKNAWNEFTMGLANNEILKGGIDLLTGLLETINKLTDALSGGSGLGKSIVNFMTVIGALKGGKALLAGGFGQIGAWMGIEKKQQPLSQKELNAWQRAQKYSREDMVAGKQSGFHGFMSGVFGTREKIAMPDRGFNDSYLRQLAKEQRAEARYQQRQAGMYLGMSTDKENIENIDINEKSARNAMDAAGTANSAAKAYENLAIKIKVAKEITPELKAEMDALGITEEQITQYANIQTIGFQQMGAAALLAGGALGLLANAFDEMGNNDAVEFCQKLSTALTGMGGVLMMLPMLFGGTTLALEGTTLGVKTAAGAFKSFGISVWAALGWVAAVVAVIWLLVKAFQAIHAASPEGKLEAATEAANDAAEAAENAAQAYEHLASALDSIGGKSAALENLAVGTTEWKNAVQELNGEVLDLVEQYPELAKFVDSSKGYLTLNKDRKIEGETVDSILQGYQDNIAKTQSAEAAAQLNKQQAQQIVDFSNLKGKGVFSKRREMTDEEIDRVYENPIQKAAVKLTGGATTPSLSKEDVDNVARAIVEGQASIVSGEKTTSISIGKENYELENDVYAELRDYGESLLSGDAAVKVFTDALLSNALMIADVSEEQKTNMMNFMSSEQIDDIRKNEKSEVEAVLSGEKERTEDGKTAEDLKKSYANTKGYEYDKSKDRFIKDGQEVAVSEDSITAQLAGIRTQENLTGRMEALDGALAYFEKTTKNADKTQKNYYASEEGIKDAFIDLTSSAEGAGLTFKAIEELSGKVTLNEDGTYTSEIFEELFKSNENLQKAYGGDIQEFLSFIYKNLDLAEAQKEKTTERAVQMRDSKGEQLAIEKADLSSGIISNVIDGLYDVALVSGNKAAQEMDKTLSDIMTDMEPEAAQKFAQAIGDLDWTNIKDVENLSNDLEDLGIASLFGEGEIDALEQKIISLAKAARAFNVDELKEAFGKSRSLAEEIRGREDTERTFTEEQMKQLIEGGGAKAEDFVWTGEDEFTYIGSSMDVLADALDRNTAAQLKEYKEGLEQKAQAAEKWNETKENYSEDYVSYWENMFAQAAAGNLEVATNAQGEQIIENKQTGVTTFANKEYLSTWQKAAVNFGMADEETATSLGIEQLIDLFALKFNELGSEAARQSFIEDFNRFNEQYGATSAYMLDSGTITGQVSSGQIASQDALSALTAQGSILGVDPAEVQLLTQEIKAMDAAYEKVTLSEERASIVAQSHANQLAELRKEHEKSAETLKDYFDEYKNAGKNTNKAKTALAKIGKEIKKTFDLDLTNEQIEENMDLFKDWANGSEDAVERIVKTFSDDFAKSAEETGVAIYGAYSDVVDALMSLPEGVHITGDFDSSNILSSITGTEAQMQAFKEFAESLNMTVTWVETGGSVTLPDGTVLPEYRLETISSGKGGHGGDGGGGGGGGGGKDWENPYDKLYNLTEKINQAIREREKLERRYDRLIERRQATAAELFENSQAEIESLEKQAELQQKMIDGRREMLQEEMDENKDLQKYATIDKETGQITINWDLINSVTDEEEGKKIEEYISKLEELRDSMQEAQDALEDIEDAIWEIEQRGREEYLEFEDRIKEALVEVLQKEIDELEEINESINDTNSKLIDSIQNSIDKMRQERENEETEQDLQEKQRRLTYLEQDTSGANAMEILDLREEIRQGQQDYTDSLIDQKISELQEQNDEAAEQREQQITLMQNQLDWYVESGRIWAEVEKLMREGMGPDGTLLQGSELMEILQKGESWKSLSEIGQMDWLLDLETLVAQSMNWKMKQGQLENLHEKITGQKITFKNANGETLTGTVDEKGNVVLDDGTYYKDVYQWIDGTYHTSEKKASGKPTSSSSNSGSNESEDKDKEATVKYKATYSHFGQSFTSYSTNQSGAEQDALYRANASRNKLIAKYERAVGQARAQGDDDTEYANALLVAQQAPKLVFSGRYKTGGLADFTGPAWLDGTKSRPELVLNQRDTQNFIQLKDILSSIMSRNLPAISTSTENNGDFSFDIDINVESLQSDYDVEQVASKVKSMIADNARYRNNNVISLTR